MLLVRNGFVYTADDEDRIHPHGAVLAVDGVIVAVGDTAEVEAAAADRNGEPVRVLDVEGAMVLPGFVNPHWHDMFAMRSAFGGAQRPADDRDDVPGFLAGGGDMHRISAVFDRFCQLISELTPDEAEAIAAYSMWTQLRAGTTTLGDVGSLNRPEALAAAATRLGMRAAISTWAGDVVCRPGETHPVRTRDADAVLGEAEALFSACARQDPGRVRARLSAVYLTNVSDALGAGLAELARRFDTGFATHLGAQRHENRFVAQYFGLTPVGRMERFGLLTDRLMAIHCAFVEDGERELLVDRRVHVNHSPAKYGGSGESTLSETGLISDLVRAGMEVSLSTDGTTFPLGGMAENMRAAWQVHNERHADHTVLPPTRALAMATRVAARGLRWDGIGSLAPGNQADMVVVPTRDWRYLLNPRPLEAFLTAGGSSDVDTVVVAGQVVVAHGRSTVVDERALEADYLTALQSFSARLHRVPAPLR
jgi:5-methylthioadenosine/S-adenosylhomocysteine deaminase